MKLVLDDRIKNDLTAFFDLTRELHFAFSCEEAYRAHPIEIGLNRLRAENVGLIRRLGSASAIAFPVLALFDRHFDARRLEPPNELPNGSLGRPNLRDDL